MYLCRSKMSLFYTKIEERWNATSHVVGGAIGLIAGICMIYSCLCVRNWWALAGIILYMAGMLGSYVTSALYHALRHRNRWKPILRKWDHAAIYWHIAGSYSPFTLSVLRNYDGLGWWLTCIIWGCAIWGTISSFRHLEEHSHWETVGFLTMGMIFLVALGPLTEIAPVSVVWILVEGACYIVGAVFYTLHKIRYMHTVFHLFVLAGSLCHIMAVWHMPGVRSL